MDRRWYFFILVLSLSFSLNLIGNGTQALSFAEASRLAPVYSNDFLVVMQPEVEGEGSNHEHANRLARKHGFENRGPVSEKKSLVYLSLSNKHVW